MISRIFLILSIFISNFAYSQCLKADIVILLDWSGSESENGHFVTGAASDFIYSLSMGPSSVKVGIIPFSYSPLISWCVPLTHDALILSNVVSNLGTTIPSGGTSYQDSFSLSDDFFKKSEEERGEKVMKIIILISDGEELNFYSNDIIDYLKSNDCLIWCIGTTSGNMSDEGRQRLMGISSGPEFYSEQTYFTLREELVRLNICP